MNKLQFLLGKLAEEAAEVSQIALKTQQLDLDGEHLVLNETEAQPIHNELNDLMAIVEMLNDECELDYIPEEGTIRSTKARVRRYAESSRLLRSLKTGP